MIKPFQFKEALGHFTTGVTVVTAESSHGHPVGVTISSFSSVSLSPPLVLFCLGNHSESYQVFKQTEFFAINLLANTQRLMAVNFSSPSNDRWRGIPYTLSGTTNCPLLAGCMGHIECRKYAEYGGGDHGIFVGEVISLKQVPGLKPLIYYKGQYASLKS